MWPSVSYEEVTWHLDPDERQLIPKSARRKIAPTYRAAIPAPISSASLSVPETLSARISELLVSLTRFDGEQGARGYDLPALLLRSESAASSQIERLTSSVRNVALADRRGLDFFGHGKFLLSERLFVHCKVTGRVSPQGIRFVSQPPRREASPWRRVCAPS